MTLNIITPATGLVVSLSEYKEHGTIDGDASDDLLTAYLLAAQEYCQRIRGEQFLPATYRLDLAHAEPVDVRIASIYDLADDTTHWIRLPIGPIREIVSVKYYDFQGAQRTLATSSYRFNRVGRYLTFSGVPITDQREDAIQVEFIAGYGDGRESSSSSEPEDFVPEVIKQAIRILASEWYRNREQTLTGIVGTVSVTVDRLLRL